MIEGACRPLMKDLCALSGVRWTQAGTEALLRLRSVFENGDWERFHAYRRQRRLGIYGYLKVEQTDTAVMSLRFAA